MTDFTKTYFVERNQTNSVKWDGMDEMFSTNDLLPLWVADMDFKLPEAIQEKLTKRINTGVFGYPMPSATYFNSLIAWQKNRHNAHIEKDWVRFSTSVVNSLNYMLQCFTKVGDAVMIIAPVYYPFYDTIKNNDRKLVVSQLIKNNTKYEIDFNDVEEKIIQSKVKLFIHCSPHNPVGRVWRRDELTKLLDICMKHNVLLISDEIHQDFVAKGHSFLSAISLDDSYHTNLIILQSASKSFNLAGLLHSHIFIPTAKNREVYDKFALTAVNNPPSLMGLVATEACYLEGAEWLDELNETIDNNFNHLKKIISKNLPKVTIYDREGTYLAWLDIGAYVSSDEMIEVLENKAKIAVDYGEWFGECSQTCIRINLATKKELIEEAVSNLAKAIS